MKIFSCSRILILALAGFSTIETYGQTGPGGIGAAATNRIWLDANTLGLPNGTAVTNWPDRSGNGWVSQSVTTSRPTVMTGQMNGFPALNFDGSNDYTQIANVTGLTGQPITWFLVGKYDQLSTSQMMLQFSHVGSSQNKNLRYSLYYSGTSSIFSSELNMAGGGPPATHTTNTSYQVFSTVTGANRMTAFTNGTQTGTFTTTFYSPISANAIVSLGRRYHLADYYMDGKIAELIVFNYELGAAERTIVENYLASKYARVIGNDKYALEASGHYYDVAGIGQETGNTVSSSRGPSIVTMSNASALGDGDYVMWGHNNTSLTSTAAGCPAFFADFSGSRLNRTYRADLTGTPGTVQIDIDMTGIGFGTGTANYVLMFDDDGDFTNGGVTFAPPSGFSYNGGTNVATWTGVTIPDGAYFTVANVRGIFSVTSGNWSSASTWNCNCVPTAADNVGVVENHTVTVDNAVATCLDIYTYTNATLLFNNTTVLNVTGNAQLNGGFNQTAGGTFTMTAGVLKTLSSVGTINFNNFTVNNSSQVVINGGIYNVARTLTVTNGDLDITASTFTLLSTNSLTARIAQMGATASITGSMFVNRFISSRAAGFSDFGSPVQGSTIQDWDDELYMVYAYNPPGQYPSAWTYYESDWDYVPVTIAATNLDPGLGFEIYLDDNGSQTTFTGRTINTYGVPNQSDIPMDDYLTADVDGWNLIGNPYASHLQWSTYRTGIGAGNVGNSYMYYDEVINDFQSSSSGTISPTAGFWIEVLNLVPGAFDFHESYKSTSNSSTFRSEGDVFFGLRLESEGLIQFTSNAQFSFEETASTGYEPGIDMTFKKVPHPLAPSLYSVTEGKNIRVNHMNAANDLVLPLGYEVGIDGFYTISTKNEAFATVAGYNCVVLEDKMLGTFHDLNFGNYRFYASTTDKSDRFVLHLSKTNEACKKSLAVNTGIEGVDLIQNSTGVFANFNFTSEQNAVISVVNMLGQDIATQQSISISSGSVQVRVPEDFSGIYVVSVRIGDKIITKKFYKG